MNYTTHYNLQKDLTIEKYDVNVVNMNSDIIDSALHRLDLKDKSQDELLATKESLNSEITRATTRENDIIEDLASEIARAKSAENSNINDIENEVTRAMLAEENISTTLQDHISDESNPHNVTKEQLELENVNNTSDMDKPVSTAQQNALDSTLSIHNTSDSSHNDMRLLISELKTRLNALADSDDSTLDQLSEIVAYIKNNKSLIDGITTSKVNISDIIDDLTTNSGNKVLSAKQGAILKGLIVDLTELVGNKVDKVSGKGLSTNDYTTSDKNKLGGIAFGAEVNVQSDWNVTDSASDAFIKNKPTSMPASDVPAWAKSSNKPTYTKSEVGLGNVENKSSATIRSELTKENVTNALGYTPPTTNTNTWRGIQNNLTSTSTTESLSAAQGKVLNEKKVNKSGDSMTGTLSSSKTTGTYLAGNQGQAIINSTASAGSYTMLDKLNSTNGYFTDGVYQNKRLLQYTEKSTVDAGTNNPTKSVTLLDESGNSSFPGTVSAKNFNGNFNNGITYSDTEPSGLKNGATWIGT